MADRSFTREVESLRLGAGQTFEGEAILAVTKALLQAGVGYVGGYQGAPVSHLMDVLADARLQECLRDREDGLTLEGLARTETEGLDFPSEGSFRHARPAGSLEKS